MDRLSRECATFCRHLIGWPPNDYVIGKYRAFHALPVAAEKLSGGTLDWVLLAVAVRHPLLTRLADAFARVFHPGSVLRKKLVLLLAILETCVPFSQQTDAPPEGSPGWMWIRLGVTGMAAGITLVAGTVLFLPVLVLARCGRWRPRGEVSGLSSGVLSSRPSAAEGAL